MNESEGRPKRTDLALLGAELGLPPLYVSSLPATAPPANVKRVTLEVGGEEISVWVPPEAKQAYRQKFKELARREKRRAADAGNAANTSQLIGGGIGGALATSGVIALATASGPLALAAVLATGVGAAIAVARLMAGHWMNKKRFAHEERLEPYLELIEEMK